MVTTENSSDSDYVPPVFYSQHDQANENKDSQQNRSHTAPSFSSNSSNNALKQHESNNHWANNSSSDKQTPTFSTHVNHSTKSKKVAPILSIPPKRQAKSATSASPNFRFGQVYKNDEIDQFSSEKPEPHFSPLDTPFDVELQSMDTQSIDSKSFEANANHNEQYETEFYESHFSTTLEEEHDFPKMEEKELTESASVTFAPITPITAESEIYPSSFSFSSATDNISLNTDEFDPISEANMDRIIDTAEITSEDDNDSRMDSSDSFHADNDLTFPESSTQFSAIDQQETTPAMNSAPAFSFVAPQKEHQEPTFHAPRTDEATKSHHDKQEPTLASPPKPMGYDVDSRSGMPIPKKPKKEFPMLGQLPSPNLLGDPPPSSDSYNKEELNEMAAQIEEQLKHFNVEVTVANIEPGPVITRFELDLAPGVKVAQINNLSKDIARALSVTSVRVVDIIPGKPYVGLEIPNSNRETVYFKEGLFSPEYREATHPLTIILGKDISGRHIIANLAKMPHLLVAGTTGSGKSVGINTMLLSLLFKAHPDELRLILIDPKMLELSVYNDIPHLLSPVVTDMKESANALRWCVAEMERRYLLMSNLKVRNIAGFNKKVKEAIENDEPLDNPLWRREDQVSDYVEAPTLEPLPYIVVVIDEFADMMMLVGKKCEELIARLAQKARASGIHLILATQRPSVDVITGLIKANIPTRISFQVSSRIDSRTIIDQQGAETLLGHGDMLYLPPGNPIPIRVHGAFIDDHEVNKVVEFLKLTGDTDYIEDILKDPTEPIPGLSEKAAGVAAAPDDSTDVLFDEAVRIVVEDQRASISYVQRRLRVGYQRAARLIEEMERQGFISAPEANGSRDVLIARYEADDDGQ